jgi:type VI secretion system protein ImpA
MPLREDLLTPIAGDNPAGENLYYDKVFDQIKEARREDEDDLPEGDWERSQKKRADHRAVIKLAGDALATRSKDIRLAAWLVEAQLRVEGFPLLSPGIELLTLLEETFWATFYPEIEDGTDVELRMLSMEAAAKLIADAVKKVPLTRSGLSYIDYSASRVVGYEKDATSDAKAEARRDAIDHGKLTAEDFDQAFVGTSKGIYVQAVAALVEALAATERMDEYHFGVYGENTPNLDKLKTALEEVHQVAELLLNERRKTEPDPVEVVAAPEPVPGEAGADECHAEAAGGAPKVEHARRTSSSGSLGDVEDAYALVVESAEYLYAHDPRSPVPYLICAGLRLGETRMQGQSPAPGYAVGPSPEVRQSLRVLAGKGAWPELMRATLPILASECARAWLDLHRYIWRAAQETGADAISEAVAGTVKSLLTVRPELRHWTLEDDTGAANPETQQWLDGTVLQ